MVDHMKYTFNGGVIKPAITIFRQRKKGMQDLRVWNPLFIQHAGYAFEVTQEEDNIGEEPEVKKIGDQINLDFTRVGVFITIYRICLIVIYIYIYIYIYPYCYFVLVLSKTWLEGKIYGFRYFAISVF